MRVGPFLLCLSLTLPVCAHGAETLVLSTSSRAPRSLPNGTGTQDRIILDAFRRIGAQVQIVHQPPERALVNANEGLIDGDCWRVGGLAAQYPNLVQVPQPVDLVQIKVFTRNQTMRISTWADLKPYNLGVLTGWKILEALVQGTRSLTRAKNIDALFTLLDNNRVDAVLVDPDMGLEALRRLQYKNILVLEPPLTQQSMFIYLNRHHADLVSQLAKALRDMKHDGTLERLTRAGPADALAAKLAEEHK